MLKLQYTKPEINKINITVRKLSQSIIQDTAKTAQVVREQPSSPGLSPLSFVYNAITVKQKTTRSLKTVERHKALQTVNTATQKCTGNIYF